jgi:hypothetical protein
MKVDPDEKVVLDALHTHLLLAMRARTQVRVFRRSFATLPNITKDKIREIDRICKKSKRAARLAHRAYGVWLKRMNSNGAAE